MTIAQVRILRLALGTALSLWFSQAVGWQMSFIAPVFTLLVLSLPLPVLKLKQGIAFVAVLAVALYSGMLLTEAWVNADADRVIVYARESGRPSGIVVFDADSGRRIQACSR